MILHKLTKDTALKILELGQQLHAESKYHDSEYNKERCWAILEATQTNPNLFIAFDAEFKGFIIIQLSTHYFSGELWAADLAFYIKPEYRNGTLSKRLLDSAEKWAKEKGATELTIYHNTGINTDKAQGFFNRVGYNTAGYIFTKDLK